MTFRVATLCAFYAAIVFSSLSAASGEETEPVSPKGGVIKLFTGKNLDGLRTWLQHSKYEDPKKVFTVKDGILHISGDGMGYIRTKAYYKDYHLMLDYRWGEKTFGSRKTMARSSGIFIHCGEHDATCTGQFLGAVECQIIEGGTGDFELIAGQRPDGSRIVISLTSELADHLDYIGRPVWKKGGRRTHLTEKDTWRISWFDHDLDWKNELDHPCKNDLASPGKEWTHLDLICDGGHITYYVNGVLANEAFDAKPCSGRIALQCEEAEIDFRRFELHPLHASKFNPPDDKANLINNVTTDNREFVPLFNGKDLSGWVNVNCAPDTFSVRDGMIHCTGIPTGALRTVKQYENFVVELEWRHVRPNGNAGLFVWSDAITAPGQPFIKSIEVQIEASAFPELDGRNTNTYTNHGDVFAIHGATMKPDRPHPSGWMRCLPNQRRSKPAGQWNHYRVTCNNGVIKLAVNGEVVSGGSECKPRKGYICLESEGSEVHFRNIRIKELPSTNPKPDEIAEVAQGFRPLYTGVDLSGWRQQPGHKGHWQAKDWILDYDGKSEAKDKDLWSEKEYTDFVLICDWRWTGKPILRKRPVILPSGEYALNEDGSNKEVEVPDAGDSGIYLRGNGESQVNIWCWPAGSGEVWDYRNDSRMTPEVRAGVTPKVRADKPIGQWNRFIITLKGDRLTVVLNGQEVISNARLPDIPPRGPIALQHHGDPIQFSNIYIKELD